MKKRNKSRESVLNKNNKANRVGEGDKANRVGEGGGNFVHVADRT